MILYQVIAAGAGIGLLEGSEIAMFTLAAAARYRWRKAWLVLFAGLLTLVPLLALLYLFFTIIPAHIATLLAGVIIFTLGAHFFYEGFTARNREEGPEEEEKLGAGLVGVYGAIILEEIEAGTIVMAIAVAAGGAYGSAVLGMVIGLLVPLAAIRVLKPLIEKLPEWVVLILVGGLMMVVATFILLTVLPLLPSL